MKNLYIVNIFLPPFLGKLRPITERLGLLFFKVYIKYLHFRPDAAIFYSLRYVFLLNTLKSMNVKILFDCVDEPNTLDSSSRAREEKLILSSSMVVATSKPLCEKILRINSNCVYVPNGADFDHFNRATRIKEKPEEIRHLQRPIIGFIGGVYDWINIDLFCKLAEAHPEYSILIVGPAEFGRNKLKKYSNIKRVGSKKFDILPHYLAFMDVCLIPFKINRVTLASNPIKLYEYLAAGKPVVSTALPEVCDNASDIVYIANDDDDFIRKVEMAVRETRSANKELIMKRINFAKENSWEKRIKTIDKLLSNTQT